MNMQKYETPKMDVDSFKGGAEELLTDAKLGNSGYVPVGGSGSSSEGSDQG